MGEDGEAESEEESEEEEEGEEAARGPKRRKGACKHAPNDSECNMFCWTAVHKGEVELVLYQDSKLIINLSTFFSSERNGFMARGSHKSSKSYKVYAPESIIHYGEKGRGATDGDDQQHKKLCISERRVVRAGTKGILWVIDRAITNAHIIEKDLAPESISAGKFKNLYTKVSFCLRWADSIFRTGRPSARPLRAARRLAQRRLAVRGQPPRHAVR